MNYSIKTAQFDDIHEHLLKCNDAFIPPLNTKVNLEDYATKLFEQSITIEAWDKNTLVGLICLYINDELAYISNVSVVKAFSGKGIGAKLMNVCSDFVLKKGCKEMRLEVNQNNLVAIHLYERFGFRQVDRKNDSLFMGINL